MQLRTRHRKRQRVDLGLGQVFAGPKVAVAAPPGCNSSFFGGWRDQLQIPSREFRFVPQTVILQPSKLPLFDHLVSRGEEDWWNVETERLGSLQIKNQLKLGRLDHRQFRWLGAL